MDREQVLMDAMAPKPMGRPVTGRRTTYEWQRHDREMPEITHSFGYKVVTEESEGRATSRTARVLIREGLLPDDIMKDGGTVAFLGYEWKMTPAEPITDADRWSAQPEYGGEPTHAVTLHGAAPRA